MRVLEDKMKILFSIVIAAALCACPKKTVDPVPVEDAAQVVEDGGGEDVVSMDAVVIESGSRPD
jgi:hypothetical protein